MFYYKKDCIVSKNQNVSLIISYGDKNTTYFYGYTMARHRQDKIVMLEDSTDNLVTNEWYLKHIPVGFLKDLYSEDQQRGQGFTIRGRFSVLTSNILNMLNVPITREDICIVFSDMKTPKTPRADVLHTSFFQHHGNIVGDLTCEMVMKMFQGER